MNVDCGPRRHRGFTLVELVVVLIVMGILAAVALPRFADVNVFESAGTGDELLALIDYARATAVAQRRMIYLGFTSVPPQLCPSSSTTACGAAANCATTAAIPLPGSYRQSKTTVTVTGTPVCFDGLGVPYEGSGTGVALTKAKTVTVANQNGTTVKTITIEAETGYVH